jgi:peptidoglycan/xylan/chitin deacetylase (PgdA/CDA1 family)
MALTVDDGNSSAVVREYVAFAERTGMRGAPYFRPPYGKHDARVDQLAAGIGYSTPVLWFGTLSDSGEITPEQLMSFADQWILPEHIVIGHANFPAVTLDDLHTRV